MDPMWLTILLFSLLIIFVFSGLPIVFTLGGIAVIFVYILWGPSGLLMFASLSEHAATNYVMIAVPLFVFMAGILEGSGIADDLYETAYNWLGGIPGGLASGTVIICAILAAMSGISAVSTITMGLIAMPSMLKRGYDRKLVIGCICSAGALGILIPPSVIGVIYCSLTGTSVGRLFLGGFLPGILISILFIIYITILCFINPTKGPVIPRNERANLSKKIKSLKSVILPFILVIVVLGTIYLGIGTPTEAAGIGAFGSIIVAFIHNRLTWPLIRKTCKMTLSITSMLIWITIGATGFSAIYTASGAADFIIKLIEKLGLSYLTSLLFMQVVFFFLGMIIDPLGMLMICLPIFTPILNKFGIDTTWFGILFLMQCEIAYISPPFGFNLFYMKAICGDEVLLSEIYRSILPFLVMQIIVLLSLIFFPKVAMLLPNMIGK